jgi:hypothetical protein
LPERLGVGLRSGLRGRDGAAERGGADSDGLFDKIASAVHLGSSLSYVLRLDTRVLAFALLLEIKQSH